MVHLQAKVAHSVFFQKEHFLLQPEFAAQSNPAQKPDLDFVVERKIQPARQLAGCHFAPSQPARMTVARRARIEIKFTLQVHPPTGLTDQCIRPGSVIKPCLAIFRGHAAAG